MILQYKKYNEEMLYKQTACPCHKLNSGEWIMGNPLKKCRQTDLIE